MGTQGRFCRTATLAVVGLVVMVGLSGCAAPVPVPGAGLNGMWRNYIERALADPLLSDFERQVLSDYQISDEEYQESRERYKECMADLGWVVTDLPGGSYLTSGAPRTVNEGKGLPMEVQVGCATGTTDYIEPIYIGMRDNPKGLTRTQQIRACFEENEVPDGADLSNDQFSQMVSDPDYHPSTPEGKLCFWDPTGANGYTVEQAEAIDASRGDQIEVTGFPFGDGVSGGGMIYENPDYTGPK